MRFFNFVGVPHKIITSLENENIPFANYIMTFFSAIFLRNFIESYSQEANYFNLPLVAFAYSTIHYVLSYITLALLLISLFYLLARIPVHKAIRVILPGFSLLLLAPLVDLIITRGEGVNMKYMLPGDDLLYAYLTFFGGLPGVSLGLKCEIFIALSCFFIYFYTKKISILRSLLCTWMIYSIIFIWGSSPIYIKWLLEMIGFDFYHSGDMMIHFYLVLIFILGVAVSYFANHNLILLLVKDIRFLRLLHYELMLLFGVTLAWVGNVDGIARQIYLNQVVIINIILCIISIFFSILFSLMMNNISDIDIDKICNKNRPLVRGEMDVKFYEKLACFFLVVSLFYASMVNFRAFLIIGVTMASYYIYSMPPLRFKRVTLFSKLVISLNSVALIVLGYLIVQEDVYHFPRELFVIYLLGITLSANLIDLKDIRGDSAVGVMTLPVLLGERQAKLTIGAATWLTYISFFSIIKNTYTIPILIGAGAIQFYLITRDRYRELPVLLLYNFSMIGLILYLIINKSCFN